MKVSWIVPGFQSDANDRCIPALTDLAHRIAQECQLKVYALQYPARRDCYRIGQVEIQSFNGGRWTKLPKLGRIGPLLAALRAIQNEPGDLLHAFWAAEPVLPGIFASRLSGRKLVISCMGGEAVYLPEIRYGAACHWLDRRYLQLAVKEADRLTCGSETLSGIMTTRFGSSVNPLVLPLGVDTIRFTPPYSASKTLPDCPLILAVGSLLPVKGFASLLNAVAELPQVKLRIAGDGPERDRLEQIIKNSGLQSRVELAGQVAPEMMPDEYRRADLLVVSSYYESQGVALLEGMACGLPVVAAPVGLAPQLLGDSAAGELAWSNAPEDLAASIQRLLERRADWAKLREAARAAAEKFSLERCSQNFLELYRSIL